MASQEVYVLHKGSPLPQRLSFNTQKASGVFVPMINRTFLSSMRGKLMSVRCGHCLVSSSEGMLRLEAFNLSTVNSLFTSIFSLPSRGSTVRLISVPNLGLFSLSWVVRKNAFCWPWIPSSVARFLSHEEASNPVSRRVYVSTVLLKSFPRTLTGTILRQTLPTFAEELLVSNAVPLYNCTPWS